MLIFIVTIFILILPHAQAHDFVGITLYWLKAVGDGENISEPFEGDWTYSPEESIYMAKLRSSYVFPKMSFSRFFRETEFIDKYTYSAVETSMGDDTSILLVQSAPVIDTKKLPQDLISNVLNRRTPLLNNIAFDETKFPNSFIPKYYCRGNSKGFVSYLDVVWQRLLIMIIVSKDLRFEKEVNDLISYLMTPNPSTNIWNEADKLSHARLTCGGGPISRVKNICIGYLNLFRKMRGKPLISTEDRAEWSDFDWSKYRAR